MATAAIIGLATTFQIADLATPTVFTSIGEIFNLKPPSFKDDTVEATHFQSVVRDYIPGLSDPGECSFNMNYVPGSASDLALLAARGITKVCKITLPNGVAVTFNGIRSAYEPDVPVDDRLTASVSWKVSGLPVQAAGAAPANTLLPSISGVLISTNILTVTEGTWSGAPVFTYQWKRGVTVIAGATNKTYTLQAADIGNGIKCDVTATNSIGNATATSPLTANIA